MKLAARYIAYIGFAVVALVGWIAFAAWVFLQEYGCGEGRVDVPSCHSPAVKIGNWLLLLSLPITALAFVFFRKMVRKALNLSEPWRNQ